jgi:3-keto-5-aminohexanoate cleavage enzyme
MTPSAGGPVIIEASLNGGTPKSRNPSVPRTPAEVAEQAIACIDAGAAMVHNHTDDPVLGGSGVHDPEPYLEAWRVILRERPGALLYPTMAGGGPHVTIERRYAHIVRLAEEGVLAQGLVDPGSTNLGGLDAEGLPSASARVYENTYADGRYMVETCRRLGVGMSVSIFEPGFLRFLLAYHDADRLPPGAMVKLYFSARLFGLPPSRPSLEAYLAMLEGRGLPWLASVFGGDVFDDGFARLVLERGGHLQVGLEPYGGAGQPKNVDLVRQAVALAEEVGRPVADRFEAARLLDLPSLPRV